MRAATAICHVWPKIMYSMLGMALAVLLCLLTSEVPEKRLCPLPDESNCGTCDGSCKGDIPDRTVVPLPLFHFVGMQNENNPGAEDYGDDFVRVLTVKKGGSATHGTSKMSKKSGTSNKKSSKASKKSSTASTSDERTDGATDGPTDEPTDKPTVGATEDPCEKAEDCMALYTNDFESPHYNMSTLISGEDWNCGYDNIYVAPPDGADTINDLYGTPENTFAQTNTVESIFLTNQENDERTMDVDPDGIGGQYAIGMLSEFEDDWLALSFNASIYKYVNVAMDISPKLILCGSTLHTNDEVGPVFSVSAIDSPNGEALLSGDVLDTALMTGDAGPDEWTMRWTRNTIALDVSGSTNGLVSIVWECLQGVYAAFDNVAIAASNTKGLVPNV